MGIIFLDKTMADYNDYSQGFITELRNIFGLNFTIWKYKEKRFQKNFLRYSNFELERLRTLMENIIEKYKSAKNFQSKDYIESNDILGVLLFCVQDYDQGKLYEHFSYCLKLKNEFASIKKYDDLYYDKFRLFTFYNMIELFSLNINEFINEKKKIEVFINNFKSANQLKGEEQILYHFYKALLQYTMSNFLEAEKSLMSCHGFFFESENNLDKDFKEFFNVRIQILYAKVFEKIDKKLFDTISAYKTLIDDLSKNKNNFIEIYVKISIKLSDLAIIFERLDLQQYVIKLLNDCLILLRNNDRFTSKVIELKYLLSVKLRLIYLNIRIGNYEENKKLVKMCKMMLKDNENKNGCVDHLKKIFYSNLVYFESRLGNIEKAEKYYNKHLKNCNDYYINLISSNNISSNYLENNDLKASTLYLLCNSQKYIECEIFYQKNYLNNILFNNSLVLFHHLNNNHKQLEKQIEFFRNKPILQKIMELDRINDYSEINQLYILYNISIFLCKKRSCVFTEQFAKLNPMDILKRIKKIFETNHNLKLIDICSHLYFNVIYNIALIDYMSNHFNEALEIIESFFNKINIKHKSYNSALFLISKLYKLKGDTEFKLKYYNEAIDSSNKCLSFISNSNKIAVRKIIHSVKFNLGIYYLMKNDLINSEYNISSALEGFQNEGSTVKLNQSKIILGIIQNLNLNRSTLLR